MVTGLWYTYDPNFGSLSWFWRCKEHPCPLGPHFGLWRMLEVPDSGLASWYWFWYGLWYIHDQNVGSLYWFWRCKEHPCPWSPHMGLWRMAEVLDLFRHLGLYLDMVTGLLYTHILNFGSLSWFWRCKAHPCLLSPDLGLWRMLEVPDWSLASWYWFG